MAGRVVRPGPRQMLPVPGVWVTLHRVAPVGAGPLDSVRTGPDGRYAFAYRAAANDSALFIVSATYAGITYFGAPLREANVSGDAAEMPVFDTTSGPLSLTVRGRHVIVTTGAGGDRMTVLEVYEVANDSSATLTGGAAGAATWSAPIPAAAEQFRVGQGDVSPAAVTAEGGRATVFAPFAPGVKQLTYSYELPRSAFPLSLPVEVPTTVLELLVEPEGGSASGAGLAEMNPELIDGRTFRRFLAQDAPAGAVVRVALGAAGGRRTTSRYAAAVAAGAAALLLLSLVAALVRRGGRADVAAGPTAAPSPAAEQLARRIAALDDAFVDGRDPSDEARAAYVDERARLKAELATELAARTQPR